MREWYLVGKVARGERDLPLPRGRDPALPSRGAGPRGPRDRRRRPQRPGRPLGCNVADPRHLTFGALANLVATQLRWKWETRTVGWEEGDHPWNVRHPIIADATCLQQVLAVVDPDPLTTTSEQVMWLWDHREKLMRL
jgi:hypothetical protein